MKKKRGRPPKAVVAKPARRVWRIDVKLPGHVYEQVRRLVMEESFFNMADFARAAIREKLARAGTAKNK